MSEAALRTRVNALEVDLEFTQQERDEARAQARGRDRTSTFSYASVGESGVRPKLERPPKFNGGYAELENVTHWIDQIEEYLETCSCQVEQYPQFARTYMGHVVQTWMAATFPKGEPRPTWDQLKEALIKRFLPPDHEEQLERKFEKVKQGKRTYDAYVEYFQTLNASLISAQLPISEKRKVRMFVKGISMEADRLYVLQSKPTCLNDCYQAVNVIKQTKTLAVDSEGTMSGARFRGYRRHSPPRKRLDKLQGEEKKKAMKEGRCIGCGKAGHWISVCPDLKKTLRMTIDKMLAQRLKEGTSPKQKGGKKFKTLKELGWEDEEASGSSAEEPEPEEDDDDDDVPIMPEEGDSGSEEGNESPGP